MRPIHPLQIIAAFARKHAIKLVLFLGIGVGALGIWLLQTQESAPPPMAVQTVIERLETRAPEICEPLLQPQAVPEDAPPKLPRIAIVIDDVGLNAAHARRAIALPAGVTLAFLPYARNVQKLVDDAKLVGHEIFLHLPMQPVGGEDAGPGMLRVDMDDEMLQDVIEKNLSGFTGYVGVNNHMGSRFTADERGMRVFMEEVKAQELIFLDSRTTMATKGEEMARALGVPWARRNIFLDNALTEEAIAAQFYSLLKIAARQQSAIAIGHPHPITLEVLERLLPYLRDKFELVPVSTLVSRP
jgi:polysaccharide deacetylase 2 family uncharacterized protein YibQ